MVNIGQDIALSKCKRVPWGSAGGCSATVLLGGNGEGVPEVISLPSLDMAGLEAAYRDVDLR